MPWEAEQGPSTLGGTHVVGVNAHKHRQAQRRDFMHLPCSCPFRLVTAAGDRPGGLGEPRRVLKWLLFPAQLLPVSLKPQVGA